MLTCIAAAAAIASNATNHFQCLQVINRVIALGERSKWGADQQSSSGSSSTESSDEGGSGAATAVATTSRWVQFGAVYSSRVAVEQVAVAAAGLSRGRDEGSSGRLLRDYLALPVDQYSLLDPKWISR